MPTDLANSSAASADDVVDLHGLLARIHDRLITLDDLSLSSDQASSSGGAGTLQIIVFEAGEARYGIDILHSVEIVSRPLITRVPHLPEWVLGVTNLHGDIISVVDLGLFLGTASEVGRDVMMLVARAADQTIGLAISRVDGLMTCEVEAIVSPPFIVGSGIVPYLRGVVRRGSDLIRLLECEPLLCGPQMQQFR